MVVMGVSTNWKANDEERGCQKMPLHDSGRAAMKQRHRQPKKHLQLRCSSILSFYTNPQEYHAARKAVQEHGLGFSTSDML